MPDVSSRHLVSRRRFLADVARLGIALGTQSAVAAARAAPATARAVVGASSLRPGALADLTARIRGPVLLPGDPDYSSLAQPNNLRYASVLPLAIARCESAEDVSQAIRWARQYAVPLVARAGGHNYAGFSTTTGLMIDVKLIDAIRFDPASGLIRIGGGVVNGSLYTGLQEAGVAITHGRCGTVGAAGFILGGGIGFNMRSHGLACDQLVETELVTPNGHILTLNAKHNARLFWACRGGAGGNFGIHTSFTLQTFPVDSITVFSIAWDTEQEQVIKALLAAFDAASTALGSRVSIVPVTAEQFASGQDVAVSVIGQIYGTPQDMEAILGPVFRVAEPSSQTIEQMAYWDGQMFLEEAGLPDHYQERSRFFGLVSDAAVATIFDWARRWPGSSEPAEVKFFQTGGQVNAVAPDATAFVHRDSHWLPSIAVNWGAQDTQEVIDENLRWQAGLYESLLAFTTGGAYQNFSDPSLVEWQRAYYGDNLERLESVKSQVDPLFFFRFAQAIPPTGWAHGHKG